MESKKINQLATSVSPQTSDLTIIGDPTTGVSKKITLLQIANLFATTGTVSSVAVTESGDALTITGSPITSAGTINIGFAGDATQYVRGDGALADFPTSTGGGSSVSYYLNSSVSQGTIGGVAYRELSKDPIAGAGTDITISANGYIASYITDANDPALLEVPGGNFNCEFYFSVNSNAHNPYVYAELYKYDGTTFTLIGSSQSVPEYLTNGTTLSPYYFAIPVAQTVLTITDRIAIRIFVNVDGRTVTLHTENNHLCQVVTTFSKGLTTLNNLTRQVQFLATGTSGTDFAISSSTATHTFNLPVASATNTGKLSSTDWSTFNNKLSTATAASTYVPYTGANANVDLGLFSLTSNIVKVIGDNSTYGGTLSIKQSNVTNLIGVGYTELFGKTNRLGISFGAGSIAYLSNSVLTAERTFTLPDASGTLALLESTQTFSGVNTFSLDILVNGLTIGEGAGSISTNTAIGSSALPVNTTGSLNTAIGNSALLTNTTGYGNTSVGYSALGYNTTGFFNAAIGVNALLSNTTGTYNNALGTASLYNNTTGSNNTAVGQVAGTNNTTGSNNTYIGFGSGGGITTGSNNTIIGQFTGTAAMANNIVLADGAGNVRYQWNGTNNVFGNPISGTSATFSSSVTASSLVKSGGTSSQFLMADGSVNTSVLPSGAYLPLTGGTLTGALSGTSATFSGTNGVDVLGSIRTDGASNGINLRNGFTATITNPNNNTRDIRFDQDVTGTFMFKANGTMGIGTSSPDFLLSTSKSSSNYISIDNTSNNYRLLIGAETSATALYSRNLSTNAAVDMRFVVGTTEAMRITSGGNVGIGTSTIVANDGTSRTFQMGTRLAIQNVVGTQFLLSSNLYYDGAWKYMVAGRGQAIRGTGESGTIQFSLSPTGTAGGSVPNIDGSDVKMVILENGNVGIGTSSPSRNLVVQNSSSIVLASLVANPSNIAYLLFGDTDADAQGRVQYDNSSDTLQLYSNGGERMRITSGGKVLVGTTSAFGNITVFEGTNDYANISLQTQTSTRWFVGAGISGVSGNSFAISRNSNNTSPAITILSNDIVLIPSVYSQTSGSAANVIVGSDGNLFRSTSSLKYKKNVENYTKGLLEVMQLRPVTYNGINELDGDKEYAGLIAEEVHELGLTEFVQYAEDGSPDALSYSNMVSLLVKAIQEQQAEIEQLKNK